MSDELDPLSEVIEQMPEPSEFADQITAPDSGGVAEPIPVDASPVQPVDTESPPPFSFAAEPDPNNGEVFNPDIHCVDENGNPRRTKSGKFRRRRGKGNAVNYANASPEAANEAKKMNAVAAAQVSVAATFIAGQIIFGPEGAPMDENEPKQMTEAYTQFYYLSQNPVNIPPWVLVAMVTATYAAKRMAMEQPRGRVIRAVNWVKVQVYKAYVWVTG